MQKHTSYRVEEVHLSAPQRPSKEFVLRIRSAMEATPRDEPEWTPANDGHCSEGRAATPPRTRVARAVTAPGSIRCEAPQVVCGQGAASCQVHIVAAVAGMEGSDASKP